MASKLQIITAAYENEIIDVASSDIKWKSFLSSAANNYKYSFADQILIYAQRPDATACAEIGFWNEKMNRWVNRGAKGIALLDNRFEKPRLHYVFDVSDTNSRINTPVPIWKVQERYHNDIIEGLEDSFGELADKSSFAESLKSVANNLIEDNYTDYLTNLMSLKENSFLEEIDEDATSMVLRTVMKSSVAYMLMSRCGIAPDEYFEFMDFQPIYFFNTHDVITVLGTATSDIAEMGMREIESTVRNLQISEKKQNRTFVNEQKNEYDEGANKKTNAERSDSNVTDDNLHEAGRLSDTRPDTSSAEGISSPREVRQNEERVSDESSKSTVHDLHDEEHTSGASSRDRQSGDTDVGETDEGY